MAMTLAKGNCKLCMPVSNHKIMECQYRRGMYCPVCIAYGHSPDDCPNKIAWAIRQGKFIKGLQNLIITIPISENTEKGVREGIKKFLEDHEIQHSASAILEYRKKLRDFANSLEPPRLVQFIVSSK